MHISKRGLNCCCMPFAAIKNFQGWKVPLTDAHRYICASFQPERLMIADHVAINRSLPATNICTMNSSHPNFQLVKLARENVPFQSPMTVNRLAIGMPPWAITAGSHSLDRTAGCPLPVLVQRSFSCEPRSRYSLAIFRQLTLGLLMLPQRNRAKDFCPIHRVSKSLPLIGRTPQTCGWF